MAFRRKKADPALGAGGGQVQSRSSEVQVHRPPGPEPLPDARHMPLGGLARDACWARLPGWAAERLAESAGERIEWWASMPAGTGTGWGSSAGVLPQAAVFGRRAVSFAEPRVDSAHREGYAIERYTFAADSHRRVEVVSTPPRPDLAQDRPDAGGGTVGGGGVPPSGLAVVPGLGPAAVELIGNLPLRAQKLLIAPFGPAHPVRRCDWYYEGTAHRFGVFAVTLVGSSAATLAHGSRVIPVGHDDRSSHWSLTCRRAVVLSRSEDWFGGAGVGERR